MNEKLPIMMLTRVPNTISILFWPRHKFFYVPSIFHCFAQCKRAFNPDSFIFILDSFIVTDCRHTKWILFFVEIYFRLIRKDESTSEYTESRNSPITSQTHIIYKMHFWTRLWIKCEATLRRFVSIFMNVINFTHEWYVCRYGIRCVFVQYFFGVFNFSFFWAVYSGLFGYRDTFHRESGICGVHSVKKIG